MAVPFPASADRTQLQNVVTGVGSFLVFMETSRRQGSAIQANRPTDLENFYKVRQGLINTGVQNQAPGIQVAQIPIGVAAFPSQQGPSSITGTFSKISGVRFDELYWRNLIFARQPVLATVGNTAKVILAAQTVGATGAHTIAGGAVTPTAPTLTPSASGTGVAGIRGTNPPISNPVAKVDVEVAGTGAIESSDSVTVIGRDRKGNEIQSTLSDFTSGTAKTTNDWFASVTGFTSSGLGSANTVKLDYNADDYYKVTLNAGDRLLNGLTIAQVIGGSEGVVDTFWDCFFQSVNFSFSREGSIDETWTVVGREASLGISPIGNTANIFADNTSPPTGSVYHAAALGSGNAFIDSDENAFVGFQADLRINRGQTTPDNLGLDGLGLALIDATITSNANVNFTPRTGQRPPGVPYKRTTDITLNFTVEYHKEYDPLVQAQLDANTLENVQIEMISREAGKFPFRKAISFAQLEFTGALTRVIDSDDFVRLTGEARALPSTLSALDHIKVETEFADSDDDWAGVMTSTGDPAEGKLRYYDA